MQIISLFVLFPLLIAFICGIAVTINFGILFFDDKNPNAGMWFCFFVGIALMVVVPTIPINGIIFHDMPPDLHVLIARISLSIYAINTFATGMIATAMCFLVLSAVAKLVRLSKKEEEATPTATGN